MGVSSRTVTFVKVIAWLGIVGGVFTSLGGLITGVMFLLTPVWDVYAKMPNVDPAWAAKMTDFMHTGALLGLIKVPFSIAAVVAGIGMLQLKSWSRPLMEKMLWFFIVSTIAMAVYSSSAMDMGGMLKGLPNAKMDTSKFAEAMGLFMKVLTAIFTLLWCSLMGACAWFLQRDETRRYFKAKR